MNKIISDIALIVNKKTKQRALRIYHCGTFSRISNIWRFLPNLGNTHRFINIPVRIKVPGKWLNKANSAAVKWGFLKYFPTNAFGVKKRISNHAGGIHNIRMMHSQKLVKKTSPLVICIFDQLWSYLLGHILRNLSHKHVLHIFPHRRQ